MIPDLKIIPRSAYLKTLFLFVIGLLSITANAQGWLWAKGEGDIGSDAANSVTVDDAGNTYITGNIAGKADFSGTVYQGRGIYDAFIAKYNPSGALLWVKLAGGDRNDQGNCIRWNKGFLYLCGGFEDTAYFESTQLVSKGESDAFIAKYTDAGSLVWVKSAGGASLDYATAVDVDNAGNVYVAGTYETSMAVGTVNLTTTSFYGESFIAKYDGAGNVVWAKSTRGNNTNLTTGIAFDFHQSVYITGFFGGSFKASNSTIQSISASYDIFIAKIATDDGSATWVKRAGSSYEDGAHAICCDAEGFASITGYFAGTAYFDNNTVTYNDYNDIFIARYDTGGNNLWVRAGRGHQLDVGFAIAADNNGNLFATGMFQDLIDFDGHILDSEDRDIYLVSYDKLGNVRWTAQAGGHDTDCGLGIAVHSNGIVSVSGYYLYTCFFGTIAIDYANANDMFVARYDPPVVGINQLAGDLDVYLFPNPAVAQCQLQFDDLAPKKITVFNSLGEIVYQAECVSGSRINTNYWAPGVYVVEVTGGEKTKSLKLVKQ